MSIEYSTTSNPNGVWSYGRNWNIEGSALDLFTQSLDNTFWWFGNWGHDAIINLVKK